MARFRLSPPARADIAQILATSGERWGAEGRRRYAVVLAAAMRKIAAEPQGPSTRDQSRLIRSVRSLHLRNVRTIDPEAKVRRPVHVLYYRVVPPGLVEIVRVLHERMEPSRHLETELGDKPPEQ
jgi:toxin ParE1/3/4